MISGGRWTRPHHLPAVDLDGLADDVAGGVGREKGNHVGHLVERRVNDAGRYRVDGASSFASDLVIATNPALAAA